MDNQMEPPDADLLFQELLKAVPEFSTMYDEHLADNDGLLPYVAMDDFARFLVEAFWTEQPDLFGRGAFSLEKAIERDVGTATLIRSTFVGTVQTEKEAVELIYYSSPRIRLEIIGCPAPN